MIQGRHEFIVLERAGCLNGTEQIHTDTREVRGTRIGIFRRDGGEHGVHGGVDIRLLPRQKGVAEHRGPRHLLRS